MANIKNSNDSSPVKSCSNPDCKQTNPQLLTEFHKRSNAEDGRQAQCKTCQNRSGASRKSRVGNSVVRTDLAKVNRRLLTALQRDSLHLLHLSREDKLNRDDAASLIQYLKFLKHELKDEEDLSTEELEKLANE